MYLFIIYDGLAMVFRLGVPVTEYHTDFTGMPREITGRVYLGFIFLRCSENITATTITQPK